MHVLYFASETDDSEWQVTPPPPTSSSTMAPHENRQENMRIME